MLPLEYLDLSLAHSNKNLRKSHFWLISLCVHIAALALFSIIAINNPLETRESVAVQLIKINQQERKIRHNIPTLRTYTINRHQLPKKIEYITQPIVNPGNISRQTTTEVIPVFEYGPLAPSKVSIKLAPIKSRLSPPRMALSKPVYNPPREELFELHPTFQIQKPSFTHKESTDKGSNSGILQDFLQHVSKQIEKAKRYPRWAMDAGIEGRVVIRFTILSDGTLGQEPRLVSSSGAEILDEAAIAAIKIAAPFPKIPPSLGREQIQIELPMEFKLTES